MKELDLIEGFEIEALLADRGYIVAAIVSAQAVIPPRSMRKSKRTCDQDHYKEHNLVERLFNKLKHFRRVATRYEKLARLHCCHLYPLKVNVDTS